MVVMAAAAWLSLASANTEDAYKIEIVPQASHYRAVTSVAFSSDGRQVLSGSDAHTVKLWDTATGALMRTFRGHSGVVTSVAFSPDGRYVLSGSNDHTVNGAPGAPTSSHPTIFAVYAGTWVR